MSEMKK